MKVLLTGSFGNVGLSALDELMERGHTVRCFDLPTKANRNTAKRYIDTAEIVWGDLRDPEDVTAAVHEQDIVVHLAFVIPRLSSTGVNCEERPDWARAINVGGTQNLIGALQSQPKPPRLIFTSSFHVYGRTQDRPPPRTVNDPLKPVEHYARHKVTCEKLVENAGLEWSTLRLGAALPVRLILDAGMFDVPLENRIEYVHRRDVGVAIANAVESMSVWGRTWLIGGGVNCQYEYREIVEQVLERVGIGMLPAEAFSSTPYSTDWLDTTESQRVLRYQRRTLDDYLQDLSDQLGYRRTLARAFRPLVRAWLLSRSPYYRTAEL